MHIRCHHRRHGGRGHGICGGCYRRGRRRGFASTAIAAVVAVVVMAFVVLVCCCCSGSLCFCGPQTRSEWLPSIPIEGFGRDRFVGPRRT